MRGRRLVRPSQLTWVAFHTALGLTFLLTTVTGRAVSWSLGVALIVVAGFAPMIASGHLERSTSDVHALRAFAGRSHDPRRDAAPPTRLTPLGMLLFVTLPLGALGAYLL